MKSTEFFSRNAEDVARDLIGCRLTIEKNGKASRYQITETEGYLGEEDTASHARFGRTVRTELMYGPAGVLYVYLIYGMHHMLNIVTGAKGDPQAVLIRGIAEAEGPGKLTKKLSIAKDRHNGKPLGKVNGIWIEDRPADFDLSSIQIRPRVGIDYATDEWKRRPLRFLIN